MMSCIVSGEFMPENRQLVKSEEEREQNKLDSWKVSLSDRIFSYYLLGFVFAHIAGHCILRWLTIHGYLFMGN